MSSRCIQIFAMLVTAELAVLCCFASSAFDRETFLITLKPSAPEMYAEVHCFSCSMGHFRNKVDKSQERGPPQRRSEADPAVHSDLVIAGHSSRKLRLSPAVK